MKYLMCTTPAHLLEDAAPDMPMEVRQRFMEDFKWIEIDFVKKQGRLFKHVTEMLECLQADGVEMAI